MSYDCVTIVTVTCNVMLNFDLRFQNIKIYKYKYENKKEK